MEWRVRRGARGEVMRGTILEGEEFACAFCKGTGVVTKTHSWCPVCSGRASVTVTAPAVLCACCGGRGEAPRLSGITCTVCRGKGAVSVRAPIAACPNCRGKGASGGGHLPCTTCRGTGVVTVKSGS